LYDLKIKKKDLEMFNYLYYVDTIDDSKLAGLMKKFKLLCGLKYPKLKKTFYLLSYEKEFHTYDNNSMVIW